MSKDAWLRSLALNTILMKKSKQLGEQTTSSPVWKPSPVFFPSEKRRVCREECVHGGRLLGQPGTGHPPPRNLASQPQTEGRKRKKVRKTQLCVCSVMCNKTRHMTHTHTCVCGTESRHQTGMEIHNTLMEGGGK